MWYSWELEWNWALVSCFCQDYHLDIFIAYLRKDLVELVAVAANVDAEYTEEFTFWL